MPKKAKFSSVAAKRLEENFKKVDFEMYKFDLHLSHYFSEKDRIRAPYIALLKLVRNYFSEAKGHFPRKIEEA